MDMDKLLAREQARRADFVDAHGTYRRNVEERDFHNMLIDWRVRGRPENPDWHAHLARQRAEAAE